MKRVAFYTLGCKVNQYDTEAVAQKFKESGYSVVDFNEYADVYVVNTCTVTHLSDRKCRQMLRKTKKLNENSVLVAMGCYAQSAHDKIKEEVEEVDIIVGTNNRSQLVELVARYEENRIFNDTVGDLMEVDVFEELKISDMKDQTRVYLKIQEGCNNYCAYCIIPYVRGKIRSRKEDNVIAEANRLVDAGFKEIILTGIHVASYGKDLSDTSLNTLLPKLHEIEGLERIRMSSIEPVVVTEEFIDTLSKLPKMCKHFHLSLQSGCDTVLKRMNRKYTLDEYRESVLKLRTLWPDVAITTDIIVGFPGESDEEFEQTVAFVKEIGFAQIHIFPYSQREGTPAATMENQVAPNIKEARAKQLKEVETSLRLAFMEAQVGKEVKILVEKNEADYIEGHTSNYIKVRATKSLPEYDGIVNIRVEKRENNLLKGYILD